MSPILEVDAKENEAAVCATGKITVFGLLKRGGRVYTKIIPDASSSPRHFYPLLNGKVLPDSIVYSNYWRGYNVLDVLDVLDVSEFKHYRINHSKLFSDKKNRMGLKTFGIKRSGISVSLTVCQKTILVYF